MSIDFDEEWYISQNADVARDLKSGKLSSALKHYQEHGRQEGRAPVRPIDASIIPKDVYACQNGDNFLAPSSLAVTNAPLKNIALVGSCFLEAWGFHKQNPSDASVTIFVTNNAGELPEITADDASKYDLQIVQISLRSVFRDDLLWRVASDDDQALRRLFDECVERLAFQLESKLAWNTKHGLLTLVANFFTPQRNPNGLLSRRYHLSNPEFFLERLNEELERLLSSSYRNAYVLDVDRLSASLGRRFVQDDLTGHISHNSLHPHTPRLTSRMEPLAAMGDHFRITWPTEFRGALWREISAMFRVARQVDSVKLVVVDLDDTLWNGVSGDMTSVDSMMIEGWPLGFAEALMYLKKRGILLAIMSKNEESRIRAIWPKIFGPRLKLEDFAALKINWRPKAENMRELLADVNLLPRSVVFVDDNPVERAAMAHEFPGIRILGRNPYYIRQSLLWAPETQVVSITQESQKRTAMVQAQLERESQRRALTRGEFLSKAAPTVKLFRVRSAKDPSYPRVFELINKTNQFNTTGHRWKAEELEAYLEGNGSVTAFEVVDNFTEYGLVGCVLVRGARIEQWVMSCRILGYQIEDAVMAFLIPELAASGSPTGVLVETDANFPCRQLFANCSFNKGSDGNWILADSTQLGVPSHIKISWAN